MTRLPNWPDRLTQFIVSRKAMPFEWGKHDCCLFAADAANAITGKDAAAAFRGKYRTELGAMRAIKRYGKGNIADTFSHAFGEPVPRLLARRGDIVLLEYDGADTVGVSYGDIVVAGKDGVVTVSRLLVKQVWRVG